MVPLLLVEILAPPMEPAEEAYLHTVLLDACTSVLAEGKCVEAESDALPPEEVFALSVVTWKEDGRVVIDVGTRRGRRQEWNSRTLEFGGADARVERWRAAGFTAATLAGRLEQESEEGAESAGPDADAAPSSPPRLPTYFVDFGTVLAQGNLFWKGLQASAGAHLDRYPFGLSLSGDFHYGPRVGGAESWRWIVDLGPFVRLTPKSSEFDLGAKLALASKWSVLSQKYDGDDVSSRWTWGGRGSAYAAWGRGNWAIGADLGGAFWWNPTTFVAPQSEDPRITEIVDAGWREVYVSLNVIYRFPLRSQ